MPKGKGLIGSGIDSAFDVDVKHVKGNRENDLASETGENFKRITISLSPSLLKKLDAEVKSLRANGASVNRSSFIADAVLKAIKDTA